MICDGHTVEWNEGDGFMLNPLDSCYQPRLYWQPCDGRFKFSTGSMSIFEEAPKGHGMMKGYSEIVCRLCFEACEVGLEDFYGGDPDDLDFLRYETYYDGRSFPIEWDWSDGVDYWTGEYDYDIGWIFV
jgi:hypothetical protein